MSRRTLAFRRPACRLLSFSYDQGIRCKPSSTSLDIYRRPTSQKENHRLAVYPSFTFRSYLKKKQFPIKAKVKAFRSVRDYSKIDKYQRSRKSLDQRIKEGEIIRQKKLD